MAVTTSKVAVARGQNREEGVRRSFELLGGLGRWVKPGSRVLLKPNIMSAGATPMITHIDTIRALSRLCKEAGAREVLVGENSVCGLPPREQFEYIGYTDALERLGVRTIFFDEEDWVYVRRPENFCLKDMHLPRSLVEADVWITLPVAKTHVATESTLGLKNSHGILADEDKARHHRLRPGQGSSLHEKFVDILAAAKPHLCVTDMFHAMEGQGPAYGEIVEMGLMLAGDDVVAVDAVTDHLMGFDNLETPLPTLAYKRGLGVADLERIEVVGERLEDHRRGFVRAVSGATPGRDPDGLVIGRGDVCVGGCGMPLSYLVDTWRKVLFKETEDMGPLYVLVGKNPPPPPEDRFIFVFGDCAIFTTRD